MTLVNWSGNHFDNAISDSESELRTTSIPRPSVAARIWAVKEALRLLRIRSASDYTLA